jgi:hypothetical protein
LSEVGEKIEKYGEPISEQLEYGAESFSLALPISRARALAVAFNAAESLVGGRGGPGLEMRAKYILDHARAHSLPARYYEIAWWVAGYGREHSIIDRGSNPAIIGESA